MVFDIPGFFYGVWVGGGLGMIWVDCTRDDERGKRYRTARTRKRKTQFWKNYFYKPHTLHYQNNNSLNNQNKQFGGDGRDCFLDCYRDCFEELF